MRGGWRPVVMYGVDRASDGKVKRPGNSRLAAIAVVGVAALIGGCGEGDDSSELPTPGPVQQTTAAATPTVDPEHTPILEGFEAFIAVASQAANEADPDYPQLVEHAEGQALIQTEIDIENNAAQGRRYTGSVVVASAEVTDLDMEVAPPQPNATVAACLDFGDYVLVDDASKSPVPVDRQFEQVQATAQLRHVPEGDRWVVVQLETDLEQPC